jgi:hypothetical protein
MSTDSFFADEDTCAICGEDEETCRCCEGCGQRIEDCHCEYKDEDDVVAKTRFLFI